MRRRHPAAGNARANGPPSPNGDPLRDTQRALDVRFEAGRSPPVAVRLTGRPVMLARAHPGYSRDRPLPMSHQTMKSTRREGSAIVSPPRLRVDDE